MESYQRLVAYCCPNPTRNPQNGHKTMLMIIFYIMLVGVVIKLWIFTIAIQNTILTTICSILTFVLLVILVNHLYYINRVYQAEQREAEEYRRQQQQANVFTADFPYVLGRTASGNLVIRRVNDDPVNEQQVEEILNSLHCVTFDVNKGMKTLLSDNRMPPSSSTTTIATSSVVVACVEEVPSGDDLEAQASGKVLVRDQDDIQCTIRVIPSQLPSSESEICTVQESEHRAHSSTPSTATSHGSENICTICLAEFNHLDALVILPCTHFYHRTCLKEWFKRKYSCPLCKDQIHNVHNTNL